MRLLLLPLLLPLYLAVSTASYLSFLGFELVEIGLLTVLEWVLVDWLDKDRTRIEVRYAE